MKHADADENNGDGEITFGAPRYENEYTYNGESYNLNIESQHDVHDGSITVGFGDYLTEDDISYYESKGYKLKNNEGYVSISEGNGNPVDYIPIDIVVEKYLKDVQTMENRMQQNLGKELGDKKLFYS